MPKKTAKTPAERKREQRQREQALDMKELRLTLSTGERAWIEQGAEQAGFEDRTEYLLSLVRHDLARRKNVTGHERVYFGERLSIAADAQAWCEAHGSAINPMGVVTALNNLGYLRGADV